MLLFKKIKIILLFFILILFSSCNDEETTKLINTSTTTGALLSEYYDKLIKFTIEAWELEAFNSSLRGIDFPIETQNEYQKTIESLEARKKLVDSFTEVLPLLDEFLKNKAGEDMQKAVTSLSNNINDIKPLKDSKVILPSDIFGSLSNDILGMCKFFEIKYICKNLSQTLVKIKELFDKENDLYESIIEDRNNKSLIVINYLINNEMVIPWGLIENAPATVGLKLAVDSKPAKDEATKKALKKVLEVKYYRLKYLTTESQSQMRLLLTELISTYNEYIDGKKIVFDNIAFMMTRLGEYFSDINDYYQKLTGGSVSTSTDIIYHGNTDSKIFHSPSCPYYNSKNSTVIFYSRDEAIEKGYSPCTTCKP